MTSKNTKLSDDAQYAHTLMAELQDMSLAAQIRVIREQQHLTQEELADLAGMKQARISLMESGDYSGFTLATLRKLSTALDVGLEVCFAPVSRVLKRLESVNSSSLKVTKRKDEPRIVQGSVSSDVVVEFAFDSAATPYSLKILSNVENESGSQGTSATLAVG